MEANVNPCVLAVLLSMSTFFAYIPSPSLPPGPTDATTTSSRTWKSNRRVPSGQPQPPPFLIGWFGKHNCTLSLPFGLGHRVEALLPCSPPPCSGSKDEFRTRKVTFYPCGSWTRVFFPHFIVFSPFFPTLRGARESSDTKD